MILNDLNHNAKIELIKKTLNNIELPNTEYLNQNDYQKIYMIITNAIINKIPDYKYEDLHCYPLQWINKKGPYKFRLISDIRSGTVSRMLNGIETKINEVLFNPFNGEIVVFEWQYKTKKFVNTIINL
jgi:hypothetical protein